MKFQSDAFGERLSFCVDLFISMCHSNKFCMYSALMFLYRNRYRLGKVQDKFCSFPETVHFQCNS